MLLLSPHYSNSLIYSCQQTVGGRFNCAKIQNFWYSLGNVYMSPIPSIKENVEPFMLTGYRILEMVIVKTKFHSSTFFL